ncbi:hypothetical protein EDB86DRAFT_1009963 [Lactarius hatsudake]|nr:hypothetical protein EDB86DRAFT_1009963 [Lactarius hatsudake]
MAAKRAVTQVTTAASTIPGSSQTSRPASAQSIAEKKERPTEGKRVESKPPPIPTGKTGSSRAQGKKEVPRAGPSVSDRPKPSTSARSTGKAGPEPRAQKKEEPKAGHPTVAAGEKKEKSSQPTKGATTVPAIPPKKVVVARTGGVTQPTLSQLARKKAAEEEKERRAVAKGTTKPLTIRRKAKAIPPNVVVQKETEIPAAAVTTPLPPSPEVRPVDVPLPESPASAPLALEEEQVVVVPSANDTEGVAVLVEEHPPTPTQVHPVHPFGVVATAKTPISALVHSIQRGFLFSPNSPLSPAQPDAEWEYPAWPGPHGHVLNVAEEPSFEGVEESTIKRPLGGRDD